MNEEKHKSHTSLKVRTCIYCGKKVSTPCETKKNSETCANKKNKR